MYEQYFINEKHKDRFFKALKDAEGKFAQDVYWSSAIYLVTSMDTTETHMSEIFDFKNQLFLIDEVLDSSWITMGSRIIISIAANLFNGYDGISYDGIVQNTRTSYVDLVTSLGKDYRYATYIAGEIRAGAIKIDVLI